MSTLKIDANRLGELRAEQGLDLDKDLAAALKMDKSTVSRVLAGKSAPGPTFIAATLQTFPVKFEDVFDIVDGDEIAGAAAWHEPVRASASFLPDTDGAERSPQPEALAA